MKKDEFLKLGLDEETAKKCEAASTEELKGYIPKARFDEVNNEKKKLELDVRDRDGQLETLKNSTGDVEGMKKQIETLQADNQKKDEAHAAEIKQLKIDAAVDAAITSAKGKNAKAIKALLDMAKINVDKDGNVIGYAEQLETLSKTEDSKFLFDAVTNEQPKFKGLNPGEKKDGVPGAITKEQFSRMSYKEKVEIYNTNKELYDTLTTN